MTALIAAFERSRSEENLRSEEGFLFSQTEETVKFSDRSDAASLEPRRPRPQLGQNERYTVQ